MEPSLVAERGVECIGDALDQATDLTARFLSDRSGMTASAAFLLNRVSQEGPARLTALATKEGVSQPSMTQLIQRLERQGLVERRADVEDGRVCLVSLTDEGRDLLDERRHTRRDKLSTLLDTLPPDEQLALWLCATVALPILQQLGQNADAWHGGTPEGGQVPKVNG